MISWIIHELVNFHVNELNPVKLWIELGGTNDTMIILAKTKPPLHQFELKLLRVDIARSQRYILSRFLDQAKCIVVVLTNVEFAVTRGQVNQKTFVVSVSSIRIHIYQSF